MRLQFHAQGRFRLPHRKIRTACGPFSHAQALFGPKFTGPAHAGKRWPVGRACGAGVEQLLGEVLGEEDLLGACRREGRWGEVEGIFDRVLSRGRIWGHTMLLSISTTSVREGRSGDRRQQTLGTKASIGCSVVPRVYPSLHSILMSFSGPHLSVIDQGFCEIRCELRQTGRRSWLEALPSPVDEPHGGVPANNHVKSDGIPNAAVSSG
jgi:hypothetical protein